MKVGTEIDHVDWVRRKGTNKRILSFANECSGPSHKPIGPFDVILSQNLCSIHHKYFCKPLTPVFMVTKSCTKISIFSTRFLCENLAAEDFVTLPMGKKSRRWGNVIFGHGFDNLV